MMFLNAFQGFPQVSANGKEHAQHRRHRDCSFFLGWEDPVESEMAPYSRVFLPGESCRQGSLGELLAHRITESDLAHICF